MRDSRGRVMKNSKLVHTCWVVKLVRSFPSFSLQRQKRFSNRTIKALSGRMLAKHWQHWSIRVESGKFCFKDKRKTFVATFRSPAKKFLINWKWFPVKDGSLILFKKGLGEWSIFAIQSTRNGYGFLGFGQQVYASKAIQAEKIFPTIFTQ